ncbi:MAG: hypothetical protein JNL01_11680 [Bdellovibrionales bacterium]|nr:hypothetical protein [Bdellovibrionales bacterium]
MSVWKPCNICKKPLNYGSDVWVCNVSTCNRKRVGLVFCSVTCWDAHLPEARHRESWAEERKAPKNESEEFDPFPRAKPPVEEKPQTVQKPISPSTPKVILRRSGG